MTLSHTARKLVRAPRSERGFTMLEVLVALLILLIGLLGLAGLLVTTQQGEMESYQRKQAIVLLQDMVDRITANPVVANCYAITTNAADGTPTLGKPNVEDTTFLCSGGSTSQNTRGSADLKAWNNALLGTSEKKGGVNVGTVIEARGCVTKPDPANDVYTVSVAWRGLASTVAPRAHFVDVNGDGTADFQVNCGKLQYLDAVGSALEGERLRRVVSTTIRIANLKAP